MAEEPTSDDLAREVTRATSANTQDRGYIPDQIDGGEQSDGIPSLDAGQGRVTQSAYDERGSLADARMPPADRQTPPPSPPGRDNPRYENPPMQDVAEQPGGPATGADAQHNADSDDVTMNH